VKRVSRARVLLLGGLAGLALLAAGCATYSGRLDGAHRAAQGGDWEAAESRLNDLLGVASREEVPEEWEASTALVALERGVVLQAREAWRASARDLSAAELELEMIDLKLDSVGRIGRYVYSDSVEEYRAPPIERTALNAVNMLNYLAVGDLAGAAVEARRYQVMRAYLESLEDHPRDRFGAYLAGFVFERLGEPARALRYYEDALEDGPLASLDAAVARTAAHTSWRGPAVARVLERTGVAEAGAAPAELLVVLSVGRTPVKVPERIPIGAAIGLAGTWITGDVRILERSILKVVVYPSLQPVTSRVTGGAVRVDGRAVETELLTDLAAEVRAEYEKIEPRILGAALSRLIVRAAAAEGARLAAREAAGGKGDGARIVGILAALGAEAALVGLDEPDTRSWTFLPGKILVARVPIAPGRHRVEVRLAGPGGGVREVPVEVAPGGYAAVVVTEPR